jgi:hypothetical protein
MLVADWFEEEGRFELCPKKSSSKKAAAKAAAAKSVLQERKHEVGDTFALDYEPVALRDRPNCFGVRSRLNHSRSGGQQTHAPFWQRLPRSHRVHKTD